MVALMTTVSPMLASSFTMCEYVPEGMRTLRGSSLEVSTTLGQGQEDEQGGMAHFDRSRWDDSPILKPRSMQVMGLKSRWAALMRARACGSCSALHSVCCYTFGGLPSNTAWACRRSKLQSVPALNRAHMDSAANERARGSSPWQTCGDCKARNQGFISSCVRPEADTVFPRLFCINACLCDFSAR